jgi:hypothetical protein
MLRPYLTAVFSVPHLRPAADNSAQDAAPRPTAVAAARQAVDAAAARLTALRRMYDREMGSGVGSVPLRSDAGRAVTLKEGGMGIGSEVEPKSNAAAC